MSLLWKSISPGFGGNGKCGKKLQVEAAGAGRKVEAKDLKR